MLLMISNYFFQTLHMINIYSRWFVLREWISPSNLPLKTKSEMSDVTRSSFRVKHINDSMFIMNLVR
jgi:hypothetical protein